MWYSGEINIFRKWYKNCGLSIKMNSNLFQTFQNNLVKFAILKIATNNPDLKNKYKNHIESHNNSILYDPFPNAGFDLLVPADTAVDGIAAKMVSMEVKCEMISHEGNSTGYYMYPRSSLSKTPLMLANHTGIIDSGYRGDLIGAFRNLDNIPFLIKKDTRLLQVCNPALYPIYVELVDENELSTTARGRGGFGSTGL